MSTFGRQNRTNTRVATAQIEVLVRGLFADRPSLKMVCGMPYPSAVQNTKGMS